LVQGHTAPSTAPRPTSFCTVPTAKVGRWTVKSPHLPPKQVVKSPNESRGWQNQTRIRLARFELVGVSGNGLLLLSFQQLNALPVWVACGVAPGNTSNK